MQRMKMVVPVIALVLGAAETSSAQKTPTFAEVPLKIAVEGDCRAEGGESSVPCDITGDSLGEYVNGVAGVTAKLDHYGNMIFTTSKARKTGLADRFLTVSYGVVGAAFPYNDQAVGDATQTWYFNSIGGVDASGNRILTLATPWALSQIPVGQYACTTAMAGFTGTYNGVTGEYRHVYQRQASNPGIDVSGTSFVVVTRTAPDTWTVEPEPVDGKPCFAAPAQPTAKVWFLSNNTRVQPSVTSWTPTPLRFRLTLTKK